MSPFLFLSIKPEFAHKILGASKTVEFRKSRPNVSSGQFVLLYASSPCRAIVGIARIRFVDSGSPTALWRQYGAKGGIQRRRFRDYYSGTSTGVALALHSVHSLDSPISLTEIRRVLPEFMPPQAFGYLPSDIAESLGISSGALNSSTNSGD